MHVSLYLFVYKHGHITLGELGKLAGTWEQEDAESEQPECNLLRKLQLCAPPKGTDFAPELSVPLILLATGFTC